MEEKELIKELDKYNLLESVPITFDVFLSEKQLNNFKHFDKDIKNTEFKATVNDFGFEYDLKNKDIVKITFGFGGLSVPKKDFFESYNRFVKRQEIIDKIKKLEGNKNGKINEHA